MLTGIQSLYTGILPVDIVYQCVCGDDSHVQLAATITKRERNTGQMSEEYEVSVAEPNLDHLNFTLLGSSANLAIFN